MTVRESLGDGISRVTLKSGKVSYEARINRAGEKSIQKRFSKRSDANIWRVEQVKRLAVGAPITDGKKFRIGEIIDDYMNYRALSTNPISSNQKTDFIKVKEDLGDSSVTALKKEEIVFWMAFLLNTPKGLYKDGSDMKPYAQATVRRFFFSLKQAVEWHQEKHEYHLREGLFKIKDTEMPKAWAGHRERRLKDGEEEALYSAGLTRSGCYTREDWEAVIGFALETAMREQEITLATFDDLENDGRDLHIPSENTKTDVDRRIFLSTKAQAIVAAQRKSCPPGETRIFHQFPSAKALCEAFIDLRARAKISDLHFHDLRHEATSRMCVEDHYTIAEIMQMTGHTSMVTFRGYVHVYERKHKQRNPKAVKKTKRKLKNKADT